MGLEDKEYLWEELFKPENQKPLESALVQSILATDAGVLRFMDWMASVEPTKEAVRILNGALAYRQIMVVVVLSQLLQIDFTKLSADTLLYCQQVGVHNYLVLKRKARWDDFAYPKEPMPADFLNEQVFNGDDPLETYWTIIFSYYCWKTAQKEILDRLAKNSPETLSFINFAAAVNPEVDKVAKELGSKQLDAPDINQAWGKLVESPNISKGLASLSAEFKDVFDLTSIHCGTEIGESRVEAEAKLFSNLRKMVNKPEEAMVKGMQGYFARSLLRMTKNDFIDETRKAKPHKSAETESQIDERLIQKGKEIDAPFLDTLEGREITERNPADEVGSDLNGLGLSMEKLTPKELWVLKDYLQGLNEGYELNSKQGCSFLQRWGLYYTRNIRALNRAKNKLHRP